MTKITAEYLSELMALSIDDTRKLKEELNELKKSQAKTDEQMKKNSEQSLIDTKDLNRQIKETNKQL
jgi:hypothetical protein